MGNTASSRPDIYSADQRRPWVYKGGYMATYKQDDPTADHVAYGSTNLQFGVKMIQDTDPGAHQGDLYVTDPKGKRLYFTHDGVPYSNAGAVISHGAGYGNGPAIMITGSPLQPQYHMFYSKQADLHGKTNQWTPLQINNRADIIKAVQQGAHTGANDGTYVNMYGDASINPFGLQEGRNAWTDINQAEHDVVNVISQMVIPIAEMALDKLIPFASLALQYSGANKAMQSGINSLITPPAEEPSGPFDPAISNMIKDPRLSGYLKQIQDQSEQYVAKYGAQNYKSADSLASDTPQQQILKARQIAQENENLYVQSQVQSMQDTVSNLRNILPPGSGGNIFHNIDTGLQLAQTNQQKMNILDHFSSQIEKQLLPLVHVKPGSAASGPQSDSGAPPDLNPTTASAQVGHPSLSINGTDLRPPTQDTISSGKIPVSPTTPNGPPDGSSYG